MPSNDKQEVYHGLGDDGSYRYFSPRASILSFASLSAHVCMLADLI